MAKGDLDAPAFWMVEFEDYMRAQYEKLPLVKKPDDNLAWKRTWERYRSRKTPKDGTPELQELAERAATEDENEREGDYEEAEDSEADDSDSSHSVQRPDWSKLMDQHKELKERAVAFRARPYSFIRVCGSYILRRRHPQHRDKFTWPDNSTLDISPCSGSRGLIACLNLGDLKGTMLIATSQSRRERICREQAELDKIEEEASDALADEEVEVQLAQACTSLFAHKRKVAEMVTGTQALRRVYVAYRCRELEPCYFKNHETVVENVGWIDFKDD